MPAAHMGKVRMENGEIKTLSVLRKRDRYRQRHIYPGKRLGTVFYDPDSGGNPIAIHCECGLTFYTGTWDWKEAVEIWNRRVRDEVD